MSLKRSAGRLEGKATIPLDGALDALSRRWLGNHVDPPPEKRAQARLDLIEPRKIGKPVRAFRQTHCDVDVRGLGCLIACRGAEQRQAGNAKVAQLGLVAFENGKSSIAVHVS